MGARRRFRIGEHALRFESTLLDFIGKSLFLYGVWELHETRFMQRFLQPGMRFVDIGANIGYHTLIAARLVGESGAVYAFEPSDHTRRLLVRNLALNQARHVTVEAVAVTDFEGSIDFFESQSEQYHVLSSTIPSDRLSAVAKPVRATTLDTFLAERGIDGVDMVKVDVEGAEISVFRGARALLASDRAPLLMFESHGPLIGPIAQLLGETGYRVASLRYARRAGPLLVPFIGHPDDEYADYVAYQDRHRRALGGMLHR
jgi:FkbM family methyltransferase